MWLGFDVWRPRNQINSITLVQDKINPRIATCSSQTFCGAPQTGSKIFGFVLLYKIQPNLPENCSHTIASITSLSSEFLIKHSFSFNKYLSEALICTRLRVSPDENWCEHNENKVLFSASWHSTRKCKQIETTRKKKNSKKTMLCLTVPSAKKKT